VDKDEIIFEEGDKAGDGYILSLGKVQLLQKDSKGVINEKYKISSMQVFGIWNSIFDSEIRLFTAKAIEKSSLLVIPKGTLDKKMANLDPFLRFCFRQVLSLN
jgi:CRP-like cAMP-binding protein